MEGSAGADKGHAVRARTHRLPMSRQADTARRGQERRPDQQPTRGLQHTVGRPVAAPGTAWASSSPGVPPHFMEVRATYPRGAGCDVLVPYAVGTSPYLRPLPGVFAFYGTKFGPWAPRATRALVTPVLNQLAPLGAVTVQRPGLPVPIQHHARTMAHHDHHATREERHRSCHDDAHPTSPRAPRSFTGGGWCGWAACSAP